MPLRIEITDDFEGIVHIGSGLVTGDDLADGCLAAFRLVENTQNFHFQFIDLSAATELQFSPEHLERIAEQDRLAAIYRPNAVVVILAPQDEFYGLGKMWEKRIRHLGWNTHVSRDRAEALQWLRENSSYTSVALEGATAIAHAG